MFDSFKRFCLDLADAFARNAKLLSYFFKSMRDAIAKPKTHFKDFLLPGRKLTDYPHELVPEHAPGRVLGGAKRFFVNDKFAQDRVLVVLPYRRLKRNGVLLDLFQVMNFFHINAHFRREIFTKKKKVPAHTPHQPPPASCL